MHLRAVAIALTMGFGAVGQAWACQPPSEEELYAKAPSVFVAHVWRTEEVQPATPSTDNFPIIEASFRVREILKGESPQNDKARAITFWCWPIPLISGFDYIFFLDHIDAPVNGSALVLWGQNKDEDEKVLTRLRTLKK